MGAAPNPAGAGMHLISRLFAAVAAAEPRRRGDAPHTFSADWLSRHRTPQARGCTAHFASVSLLSRPNPAGAGMHRENMRQSRAANTEPRRRGDAPLKECKAALKEYRTPQARGCTAMYYTYTNGQFTEPRRRGDAPTEAGAQCASLNRTPQARGCTAFDWPLIARLFPNPAGAGMHRSLSAAPYALDPEPRRRGDAPGSLSVDTLSTHRTPQARGCTGLPRQPSNRSQPEPRRRGDASVTSTRTQSSCLRAAFG